MYTKVKKNFTPTIFTGWISYVTPWYAEMVEYCLKNGESVLYKPNPTDLSKFIMCNNYGILFEMQCPAGTLFDAQLEICNHNYGSTSCGDCEIINDIGDSMAPKWLTKPTKTTTIKQTTTIKPLDDYDTVSNCSEFAFDGFRYVFTITCGRADLVGIVPLWAWGPCWRGAFLGIGVAPVIKKKLNSNLFPLSGVSGNQIVRLMK